MTEPTARGVPAPDPQPAPRAGDALIVIDLQRDFCSGGALAVPDGDAVVAPVNRLAAAFPAVAATQDWHPPGHASFASSHAGRAPFETVAASYGPQTLWPDHCVIGTAGAGLHPGFDPGPVQLIVRKGFRPQIDSYSAFFENDRETPTGLAGWLRARAVTRAFFAGLATDFCVRWSVEDALREGFRAVLVEDACRAIDLDGSGPAALDAMAQAGASRARVADILGAA